MKCPFCKSDTKIYNSRSSHAGQQTWRRHQCKQCHRKFTTREKIDWNSSVLVQNTDGESPYSHERLLLNLAKACSNHPNGLEAAAGLLGSIEQQLSLKGFFGQAAGSHEVIRTVAYEVLKRFDKNVALQYLNIVYGGNPPLEMVEQTLRT